MADKIKGTQHGSKATLEQAALRKSCTMRLTCNQRVNRCKAECHNVMHFQSGLGINPVCGQAVDRHEYWASSDSNDVTCLKCKEFMR